MFKKWLPFIIVLIIGVLTVYLANRYITDNNLMSPQEEINYGYKTGRIWKAKYAYRELLENNPNEVEYHYGHISAHFSIKKSKRNDDDFIDYYNSLSVREDILTSPFSSKILTFALGRSHVLKGDHQKGLNYLLTINDTSFKYLNHAIGDAYAYLSDYNNSELYFKKELENYKFNKVAYKDLALLYHEYNKKEKLNLLFQDPEAKKHIPRWLRQKTYFLNLDVVNYYKSIIDRVEENLNLFGFWGALLVLLFWLLYLRQIDIFEIEKWWQVLMILALGMLFSLNCLIIYDFAKYILGFQLKDQFLNDFLYCVFVIGFSEEFVKILPVLIMLKFTKAVNEPFDYILYASLSALGFAFVENLLYLNDQKLYILYGRGFVAAVGHMFDTSVIAYGMILSKYKYKKYPLLFFWGFFFLAALAHGFYDFWLIKNFETYLFKGITLIFFLSTVFIWNSFKNNALNHSGFYDKEKFINTIAIRNYLLFGLSAIIIYQYITVSLWVGIEMGNRYGKISLVTGSFFLLFLTKSLGRIRLKKGHWGKIRIWGKRKIDLEEFMHKNILIGNHEKNSKIDHSIPNIGEIIGQYTISNEPDWLLVKLKEPINNIEENVYLDHLLIRTVNKDQVFTHEVVMDIYMYLIKDLNQLTRYNIKTKDFCFAGLARVRVE